MHPRVRLVSRRLGRFLFPKVVGVLATAFALTALPGRAEAQNTYTWQGASGGGWATVASWLKDGGASTTFPGLSGRAASPNGDDNDVAVFSAATTNTTTNVGLNFNTTSANFSGLLSVGAISVTQGTALTIGSSSMAGVLQLNGGYAGNTAGLDAVTLLNVVGANLTIAPRNSGTTTANVMGLQLGIANGVFNVASGRTLTISSLISQATGVAARINVRGGGTLVLTNTSNSAAGGFTGGIALTGAGTTLSVSSSTAFGVAPTNYTADAISLGDGTVLRFTNTTTLTAINGSATRGIAVNAVAGGTGGATITAVTDQITYAGVVSGAGRLTVTGAGGVVLTGSNTLTGGVRVTGGGTLVVSTGTSVGAAPSATFADAIILDNGTLRGIDGSDPDLIAQRGVTITPNGAAVGASPDDSIFIRGKISETAAGSRLTINNGGTVNLYGASNAAGGYSGGVTVSGSGTRVNLLSGNNNLGLEPTAPTAGFLTLLGGTTVGVASTSQGATAISANRGVALGPTTGAGTVTFDNVSANTFTVSSVVANNGTGTGSLTKTGAGILVLANENTYTGATTVSGGTFRAGANNAFGVDSALIVTASGAAVQLRGFTVAVGSLAGVAGASLNNNLDDSAGTLVVGSSGTGTTYAGRVWDNATTTSTLALRKTGAGALTLANTSTTTGTADGTSANSYGGGTTIDQGAFYLTTPVTVAGISGTGTGSVVVNATGTLGGTGFIIPSAAGASVAVNAGGTVRGGLPATAPGGGAATPTGTLTVTGLLTLKGGPGLTGGTLLVDLNGTADTNSAVAVTGGTGAFNFDTADGLFNVGLVNDQSLPTSFSLVVASALTGGFTINNAAVGGANVFTVGTNFNLNSSNYTFSDVALSVAPGGSGDTLVLSGTATPVPEPTTVLGLAAGGFGLAGFVRRKARRPAAGA